MIEANKSVSVQYGALYQNERDGGAYVPSSNGSSSVNYSISQSPIKLVVNKKLGSYHGMMLAMSVWSVTTTVVGITMQSWTLNSLFPCRLGRKAKWQYLLPYCFQSKLHIWQRVSVLKPIGWKLDQPILLTWQQWYLQPAAQPQVRSFLYICYPPRGRIIW